ncbi:hypothetical protein [Muricoccus radiodurans]|uniref:hypothetical protein n=1 Tax=Muricoccus radiodurans TaxID=2231721 RepID=UPI003CEEAC20
MRRLVVRALRPLKRLTLWLTGEREVHARLDRLEREVLHPVREGTDSLHTLLHRLNARLDTLEVVVENAARPQPGAMPQAPVPSISEEIDRLDGYLLHHMAELRREILALRQVVEGRPAVPAPAAPPQA